MDQVTFERVASFYMCKVFTSEEGSEDSKCVHGGGKASGGYTRVQRGNKRMDRLLHGFVELLC